ncbi:ATP-binding protein [Flavobacterium sp. RNTU_13]|uniref:sensor histidine kinase n=1 Tax=Flavobacterium sp. RNTU_13 TaxID=3375145 RepID=UPI003985A373
MKIRTRLSLLYLALTAAVLLGFAFIIYISAKNDREKEFYTRLEREAVTKANLYFDAKVDAKTLQDIYKNNRLTINEVEVAIFSEDLKLLYHDSKEIDAVKETRAMLTKIRDKGHINFTQNGWQVTGILHNYKGKNYIITAIAYDKYGYKKLDSLFKTSVLVFFITLPLLYFLALYFSKKALEPITDITEKANLISGSNLHLRLDVTEGKDELNTLSQTFNIMLTRLENSFDSQKQFISNISHEIRTPLAAIITELELADRNDKTVDEYRGAVKNALKDASRLVKLSNSLLDLAKASYDPSEISMRPVRADELLLDALHIVQVANKGYEAEINFDGFSDSDSQVTVNGNEYLLRVAFMNIIENACKFSTDKRCRITISFNENALIITFSDNGIGIEQTDIDNLFTPFYRGKNKKFAEGNGIGLSLTRRIVILHNGTISVTSVVGKGSEFVITLPHL